MPDPTLSIDDGALVPWAVGSSGFYESVIQAIAERYEIPTDVPWQELTEEEQDYFLYGTDGDKVYVQYRNRMGRRRSYMVDFEGIVSSLAAPLPRDGLARRSASASRSTCRSARARSARARG